jgi:hypothetical protein
MPSKLDPHVALIEDWLVAEPQLTAIAIVDRLADLHPDQFNKKQHSIVQRLPRALRRSASRPQPLSLFQPSTLIHQPPSYSDPPGNILR